MLHPVTRGEHDRTRRHATAAGHDHRRKEPP
uniref:Uncharacterized protein n=1 Tax=Siphoviridae sp. ctz7e2 TaxID=2826526 RepID=A0A8S5M3S3_9CAUD|nr:MAG TPA: hypothetical protein [Siphoviridae sp. ctz7e2]